MLWFLSLSTQSKDALFSYQLTYKQRWDRVGCALWKTASLEGQRELMGDLAALN